jgi:hypothetical protein
MTFIMRIRTLAKGAAEAWVATGGASGGAVHVPTSKADRSVAQ